MTGADRGAEGHASDAGLVPFRDDARLRASRLRTGGDRLVVVFNSIGGSIGHDAEPGEFRRILTADPRNTLLFLTDAAGGWFATGGVMEEAAALVAAEAKATGARRVMALGASMGGYGALALGGLMALDVQLAFAPRFSPDDVVVPDRRLARHRARLAPFAPCTAEAGLKAARFAVVIHGLRGPDRRHAERFGRAPGLRHYLVPGQGHRIAKELKEAGTLGPLIAATLAADGSGVDRLMAARGAFVALPEPEPEPAATGAPVGRPDPMGEQAP